MAVGDRCFHATFPSVMRDNAFVDTNLDLANSIYIDDWLFYVISRTLIKLNTYTYYDILDQLI